MAFSVCEHTDKCGFNNKFSDCIELLRCVFVILCLAIVGVLGLFLATACVIAALQIIAIFLEMFVPGVGDITLVLGPECRAPNATVCTAVVRAARYLRGA